MYFFELVVESRPKQCSIQFLAASVKLCEISHSSSSGGGSVLDQRTFCSWRWGGTKGKHWKTCSSKESNSISAPVNFPTRLFLYCPLDFYIFSYQHPNSRDMWNIWSKSELCNNTNMFQPLVFLYRLSGLLF